MKRGGLLNQPRIRPALPPPIVPPFDRATVTLARITGGRGPEDTARSRRIPRARHSWHQLVEEFWPLGGVLDPSPAPCRSRVGARPPPISPAGSPLPSSNWINPEALPPARLEKVGSDWVGFVLPECHSSSAGEASSDTVGTNVTARIADHILGRL